MPPLLTREADLRDQRLQRWGGHLVGMALGLVGSAGLVAWGALGQGSLPAIALLPPGGLLLAGVAVVSWSRGIEVFPDPELPTHDELPADDPRVAEALSLRRARWVWAASAWAGWMTVWSLGAWFSHGLAPGVLRMVGFLALTLPFTLAGARWLEQANGESSWPAR